ncbi:MAG: hypothetical protein H6R17_1889 [Proteobacteria bacterium]|nr:hypothetical protein [Pseudomonadota bacterium]
MKAFLLAILALLLSQSAFAQYHGHGGYYGHGGHGYYGPRVGFYFGAPYPWVPPPTYYYPPPVVYAPPVVTIREAPTVYIEQDQVAAPVVQSQQTFEPGYWYYCQERQGYYPTVKSCPSAWQKVAPSTNR